MVGNKVPKSHSSLSHVSYSSAKRSQPVAAPSHSPGHNWWIFRMTLCFRNPLMFPCRR